MSIAAEPHTPAAAAEQPAASFRWALAALALSTLLAALGTSIANVGLPTLALAFDASFAQVQWIVLAYLLAVTSLVVGVGRLGDILGRRRLLMAGQALFTAASALCAIAPTLGLLIAARAAQGAGAAVMMAQAMALVGETVPKSRTGSAMGLLGTMSAIGTALGPSLGGALIAWLGWPAIFLVTLPLGALAIVLAGSHLPADRRETPSRQGFDAIGMTLLALTLAAFAFAMAGSDGGFGLLRAMLLLAAAAGALLFLLAESRAAAPLVQPALFRDRALGDAFATNILATTVVMATLVVGPFHLAGALALDAARVGLVMTSGPLVAALTGVPAGRAVDRFGARRIGIVGLLAMTAGAALLSLMPVRLGLAGYVAPLAVTTAGYALFQAANNTAVMTGIDPGQRGLVSGLLNLSRNLGLITGAAAMGAVFAWGAAAGDIATAEPDTIAAGMRRTFAVATGLLAAAIAITLAGPARATRPPAGRS